jgi:hypothetical protein
VAAEGAPILAALLLSGEITVPQFYQVAANLVRKEVNWPSLSHPTIHQASYHSAMFMHGLRACHGLPVTAQEFAGASYFADSTYPVFVAQRDFALANGLDALGSQVMSQNLNGYPMTLHYDAQERVGPTSQCLYPGNEEANMPYYTQNTGLHALARNTSPHALFVPLMRPSMLASNELEWIFSSLAAYSNSFFHTGSDTRLGWECAIPWKPADTINSWTDSSGRRCYSDSGRPYEALNSAYILLACFDALNKDALASYSAEGERLGHIAAYFDQGTLLPAPVALLTTPANNSVYSASDPVLLSARASTLFGMITQMVVSTDGLPLAIQSTNSFAYSWTNASVGRHLLQVQVWDNQGRSASSAPVTVEILSTNLQQATFVKGLNAFALAVNDLRMTNAEAMAQYIPQCQGIWRWESSSQQWQHHVRGSSGNNFPINTMEGFFIEMTSPGSAVFNGPDLIQDLSLVNSGYNLIGVSAGMASSNPTANSWLQGNRRAAWRWNSSSQAWEGHPKDGPSDFTVDKGQVLLIYTRP